MFCYKCGTKLPDEAIFCMKCGTKLSDTVKQQPAPSITETAKLVPAKCTSCGGSLTLDPKQETAVCPYCNTSFLVKEAINNFNIGSMNGDIHVGKATINVNSINKENLLERAKHYECSNDFDNALVYYNKVLDIDVKDSEANLGIHRAKQKMEEYIYITGKIPHLFSKDDIYEVRRTKLTIIKGNGKKDIYYFTGIRDVDLTNKGFLGFKYEDYRKKENVSLYFNERTMEIYNFIKNARQGKFPSIK